MTVLAITGGVGGAKLALGLARVLPADKVVFLVNTGDDFQHFGLHISPDLDTLCYTLAGCACPTKGWGRRNESWTFMETVAQLNGPVWFQLGDRDLATHAYRTQLLQDGHSLTEATRAVTKSLGIEHTVLPVSDDPIATIVDSDIGELAFQRYFVEHQCRPVVNNVRYNGASAAQLNQHLDLATISLVVLCPSNPFLSIDPILAISALRNFLQDPKVPVVAISPIVRGQALKGPTTKIMEELGHSIDNLTIIQHYGDILTGFVVDSADSEDCPLIRQTAIHALATNTVMTSLADKERLALETLEFGKCLTS